MREGKRKKRRERGEKVKKKTGTVKVKRGNKKTSKRVEVNYYYYTSHRE